MKARLQESCSTAEQTACYLAEDCSFRDFNTVTMKAYTIGILRDMIPTENAAEKCKKTKQNCTFLVSTLPFHLHV